MLYLKLVSCEKIVNTFLQYLHTDITYAILNPTTYDKVRPARSPNKTDRDCAAACDPIQGKPCSFSVLLMEKYFSM